MSYTKMDFEASFKQEMAKGYDMIRVARWAHREYLEHGPEFEPGLLPVIMQLIAMEEGPEFEMTENEVRAFINEKLHANPG